MLHRAGRQRHGPNAFAPCAASRELIEQRVYDTRRRAGTRGRQEPDGVDRRGPGDRRSLAWYCDQMEERRLRPRASRRSAAWLSSRNRSVLKPYGVWAVVAPFNFPFALAGGPVAAALVTGNTVVFKTAPATQHGQRLAAARACCATPGVPAAAQLHHRRQPTSARRWSRSAESPASPSPARTTSAWTIARRFVTGAVCPAVHRRDGRQECRRSSAAMPISNAPPPASCARPSACRDRNARRCSRVYRRTAAAGRSAGC